MYRKKERMGQRAAKIVSLEDLVPQNHLLRKVDGAIDFDFIYDEVKGMYSEIEWGKPGLEGLSRFLCKLQTAVQNRGKYDRAAAA